jgi:hypothetical protein
MTALPIEVTRLVKDRSGQVTKRIHLAQDGTIANDSSDCRMSRGVMHREAMSDWRDFALLIEETPRNTAYALGALRHDLPPSIRLVAKADPQSGRPEFATRTAGTILYLECRPGFVLCDFDVKGMPHDIRARLQECGGFGGALGQVCTGFEAAGHICRRSTSAGVYNEVTGEQYSLSAGEHLYLLVQDGTDARRFLYALHDRCWLVGLGWYIVGKAGQLLERSIVDRMVCAPERLVFEANPDLDPPLKQERREAAVHDGDPLDTKAACLDLNVVEQAELHRRKAAAAHALRKEAEAAKKAFIGEQIEKAVACGIDRDKARLMAEQWGKGILRPGVIVEFDDPDLGAVSVADVLANPDHYDRETLADPIEGVDYGRNCAVVQVRSDGVYIFSFAHGGGLYKLCHDYASVEAAVLSGAKSEAVNILCRLVFRADLDSVERKLLAKLAGKRSGAGLRAAETTVKEEGARQKQEAAEARRRRNTEKSTKVRLAPPLPDAEAGPVMETWDEILCHVDAPEPPMRDAEGCPVEIQCRETAGLHELTAQGANDEEDEKSRLPSPKNFLLTKHDKFGLEIEISDYVTFVQESLNGERYVAPPDRFLIHYLKYSRSKLPRVHAVVTMPLVLANGTLLDRNGLDRKRRAVFRVDPALLEFMPKPEECTEDDVAKAYKFLVDEWLVDVATDTEGKCVLLAYALSIIERVLFPERPVFFVTAGQRGGGKTTALIMATLAATGVKPAAAAWTNDSEERKKSLFAIFREGLPTVIWDNIPRGLGISCPHIERASTTEIYQDRILGVTQQGHAPAYTIMGFTGNNIRPKSDHASRSLEARLTAERPDPENRPFVHPDPIGWTLDHRGEILRSLYVILLGNPQLRPECRREAQTRFKTWWRLVGSAVEHAAETVGQIVSFKAMFARVEGNDDEAAARADILQTLCAIEWPVRAELADKEFTSANLLARLDESAKSAEQNGRPEDAETAELRRFCTPKNAKAVSSKTIGLALKSIVDAPVAVLAGMLALRSRSDTHNKVTVFWVELKLGKP